MSRVYLDLKNGKWNEVAKSDFWIDKYLLNKLKAVKKIQSKNWDSVILIDGMERSGKSVLGMLCGWYLSHGLMNENNFARGLEDCAKKIAELPDRSVLFVDEGSTIFGSKDTMGKQQKILMKILDVVGQKNLIFIICLPCVFDLNKTIAVRRSKFLLHVYPDIEYNRGKYAYWGENTKKKLYRIGKKDFDSYEYPRAEFVGQYFDFHPPFYEKYLKEVKMESLRQVLAHAKVELDPVESVKAKELEIMKRMREEQGLSYAKIGVALGYSDNTVRKRLFEDENRLSALEKTKIEVLTAPIFKPLKIIELSQEKENNPSINRPILAQ